MDVRAQDKNISPGGGGGGNNHGDSNNGGSANNAFCGSNSTNKTLAAHHHRHHGAVIPADPARVGSISFRSKSSAIRYRECLKNHGASMGTNVLDGCGEFMPSGQEGTLEALNCAACKCHRNFHRKEVSGEEMSNSFPIINMIHPIHNFSITHHQMVQPVNAVAAGHGGGATESSSEDLNNVFGKMTPEEELGEPSFMKKRFRTKFTPEQKERMMEFADKLGWRLQKQDDEQVERFCDGLGIRRQVFKVWMHNNKSGSASKKTSQQLILDQDLQQQPQINHQQQQPL